MLFIVRMTAARKQLNIVRFPADVLALLLIPLSVSLVASRCGSLKLPVVVSAVVLAVILWVVP